MHRGVYEFYKPSGPQQRPHCTREFQPQAFGFIKFVDSLVHAYNYYLHTGLCGQPLPIEHHLKQSSQFLPQYTAQSITVQSTRTIQYTMHFPTTTPSTKCFPLECAYYSMVFIVLVYNSGSQNILINDCYACLHVLSKQLAVWNA